MNSELNIKENFELKHVCTFAIGGPARYFIAVKSEQELILAIDFAKQVGLPTFIYGGGSNLLFPDEGLNKVVIKVNIKQLDYDASSEVLELGAGVTWGEIARYCTQNGLYGFEAMYGLPGTIGGAVYGNAGCHGLEIKDRLVSARLLDTTNNSILSWGPSDFEFSYRHSSLKENKHLIVLNAKFKASVNPHFSSGDPAVFAEQRKVSQPTGLTTGSFFKNPPNDYAGRLIEEAGLKNFKINGIGTSDKHANFFINYQNATAEDVIKLKAHIQEVVLAKFGVMLEPEVQIVKSQE